MVDSAARTNQRRQFVFIQAKRLFAENRFPRVQGRQRLAGMKVMTSGDQHRFDLRILQQLSF